LLSAGAALAGFDFTAEDLIHTKTKAGMCCSREAAKSMTGKRAGRDGRGEGLTHQRIVSSIKSSTLIRCKLNTMTTRTEKNIRSLTKVSGGSSYGVTLPIEYIRKLKWKTKQKLEVTLYQDRIIIRDWKSK